MEPYDKVSCLPGCDDEGGHEEDCPWVVAFDAYWSAYYGKRPHAAMDPRSEQAKREADFRCDADIPDEERDYGRGLK